MPADRRDQRERLALRGALLRLVPPLETFAENVLGLVSRIDLVARDPDGAVTVVLVASVGDDLARLAEGFAQRAWLAPRLPDWCQLAPHLGLAVDAPVGLLLVAPRFDERTRAAAAALGPRAARLAERLPRGDLDLDLRLVEEAVAAVSPVAASRPAPREAVFRTGLRD